MLLFPEFSIITLNVSSQLMTDLDSVLGLKQKTKLFQMIPQVRTNAAFLAKLHVPVASNNRIPLTKSSKCPSSFFCQLCNKYTAVLY